MLTVVVGGIAWWMRRFRVSLDEQLLQRSPRPGAAPATKSWEQHVAEQLARRAEPGPVAPAEAEVRAAVPVDLTADLLRRLEWKRFELFTARYFAATGMRAEMTCIGADGGVDVKLYRLAESHPASLVQCKAWGSEPIGVALVRELRGVMAAERVAQGIFVTTSGFTPDAQAFAKANEILALSTQDVIERFQLLSPEVRRQILTEVTAGDYMTPTCPSCDVKLVLREGGKSGRSFWGCRRFPRCSFTMIPRADSVGVGEVGRRGQRE